MMYSTYFVTPDGVSDELVLAAAIGGASIIQLRDKSACDEVMIAQAIRLKAMLAPFRIPLIINDRLDVALKAEADGLHIGQGDGDPREIHARLGSGMILGLSIETGAQLAAIPTGLIDYIGVGPMRATPSKKDHATPLGFAGMEEIIRLSPLPVIAIGGVKIGDSARLKSMGCAGLAVVSAISDADDPEQATRALVTAWRDA